MYDYATEEPPFQPTLSMTLRGHRHGVRSVAFLPVAAPSTSLLPPVISGGMDGAVIAWDTVGGARAVRCTGHRGPVLSVAPSTRAYLFASGGQDGYVRVWTPGDRRTAVTHSTYAEGRASSSACEWRAHTGATRAVAFARDGSDRLYTVGDDKAVKAWDLATLTSSSHYRSQRITNKFAGGFAGSPLSSYATYGGASSSGHTTRITALAVQSPATASPSFHYVASGGEDGVVFVWDTRSRTAAHVLYGNSGSGAVNGLCFHPDGHVLATGDDAGDVNLFDLRCSAGAAPASIGSTIASYSLLQHYHAAHAEAAGVGTRSVDFAPNGGWLLSAGDDGTTKLWDVKEGHLYCTVQAHEGPVASCRFSDDGAWFVTGGGVDKTVLIWRSGLAAAVAAAAAPASASSVVPHASVPAQARSASAAARELPYHSTSSAASFSMCSSERRRVVADDAKPHTRLNFTPAASERGSVRDGHQPEVDSPARVRTRSISTEKSLTPSRRPPIPLAPPSSSKTGGSPVSAARTGLALSPNSKLASQYADARALDAPDVHRDDDDHRDGGGRQSESTSARERSFERCEQRYSHLVTPPASPSPANGNSVTSGAAAGAAAVQNGARPTTTASPTATKGDADAAQVDCVALEEREQALLQAQEREHHREQRDRILEERVANLEDAVAALVAYMQRQQSQHEERLGALQAESRAQAQRNDTAMAELQRAIALLTSRVAPGEASTEESGAKPKQDKAAE